MFGRQFMERRAAHAARGDRAPGAASPTGVAQ